MRTTRVLLAEDDEDHRFFTVRAIKDARGAAVEVSTVADGEEALAYLDKVAAAPPEERPHLVLLDLRMPRVDGLTVLARIKSDEVLRHIPVVVLSSSDRPEDVEGSYALGANCYVTKPQRASGLREHMLDMARYWLDVASLPQGAAVVLPD